METAVQLKEAVRALAFVAGFDAVRFAAPALPSQAQHGLQGFLEAGHHGDMDWMETNADRRASPSAIWPEARSVIVLGHNYAPERNPLEKLADPDVGSISCYAQGDDYHDVIKKKLKELARTVHARFACEVKVFVDTAPVMEKPLAQIAGLGWQGKHTCIVSREFGAWLFLGEIFTTLPIAPDEPESDHCGNCSACLDICPTGAFEGPRRIDARKCISYLTIEHKGVIAPEYRPAMGNRIYGCDDCLAACPWNKFAQTAQESAYHARLELKSPPLDALLALDDAGFRQLLRKSPIKRIGRDRFLRNVLIATGNSGNPDYIGQVQSLLADASPLVRGMAVWALGQLTDKKRMADLRERHYGAETDSLVLQEWKTFTQTDRIMA